MASSSSSSSPPTITLPRLPQKSDFSPSLTFSVNPPSTGSPINILILLHGLGDTHDSFTTLGKNLNLPETACLSIRGTNPIPPFFTGSDRPSFHWGDDMLFDEGKGEIELDTGFSTSTRVLTEVVQDVLMAKCAFPPRNILLYGFGQGGMAALSLASSLALELGGIVSIGGPLPSSSSTSQKCKTPVLICGGSRSKQVTRQGVDRLKGEFENVEYVKWEKAEDSMPRSREEMLPVMKFFARRLRSRVGVPEGAVEI